MVCEESTGLLSSWKEIEIGATSKSAPAAGGQPLTVSTIIIKSIIIRSLKTYSHKTGLFVVGFFGS